MLTKILHFSSLWPPAVEDFDHSLPEQVWSRVWMREKAIQSLAVYTKP